MANTPGSPDPRFAGANNAWLVFRSLDSYRPRFLTCDLVAGLTLAAIAIPEQSWPVDTLPSMPFMAD
jgi:MFS superfamily sulfate permease-like transporter